MIQLDPHKVNYFSERVRACAVCKKKKIYIYIYIYFITVANN